MHYTVNFLFEPAGKEVLMVRKAKTAYKGKLNGCGGKIETGETPSGAAIRSIKKETGVELRTKDLRWLGTVTIPVMCEPAPNEDSCTLHFYSAIVRKSDIVRNPDFKEALEWTPLVEIVHAPPVDTRIAGDGDVAWAIHMAAAGYGFWPPMKQDLSATGPKLTYRVEVGIDGDDFIYADGLGKDAAEQVATRLRTSKDRHPDAYVRVVQNS